MSIETRRNQHQIGLEAMQGRQPVVFDSLAEPPAVGAGFQRGIDDVLPFATQVAPRIEGELEAGADQDIRIILENIDGAVALMDVEIEYGDAPGTITLAGMSGSHRHVVVETETHGIGA